MIYDEKYVHMFFRKMNNKIFNSIVYSFMEKSWPTTHNYFHGFSGCYN